MENANINQPSTSSYNQEISGPKHCWVCFSTDEDDDVSNRDWVSPCKCRGSARWVHQDCVQRWVDEKLKDNLSVKVLCPQCRTEYIIIYDEVNYFVQVLNKFDETANRLCIFLAAGAVVGTFIWSAASYGAITMMQVMGEREAITMMEDTDVYVLFFVLPTIPLGLILVSIINWEEPLLLFVQNCILHLPLLRTIMPSFLSEPVDSSARTSDSDVITTFCTALLLPTTAIIVGNLLFDNSSYSYLEKTLLGGLVFIAVKGVFRIYQRQHNAIRAKTCKVINYPESDIEENN